MELQMGKWNFQSSYHLDSFYEFPDKNCDDNNDYHTYTQQK